MNIQLMQKKSFPKLTVKEKSLNDGLFQKRNKNFLQNPVHEEKRNTIFLIKTENAVNNGIMDNVSNEKQGNSRLFNLCLRFFKGFIKRLDNIKLPVHFTHHTLQDYFDCFKLGNLNKVKEIHELKVTKMHLKKNNKFFNNIKDLPLHLLFILEK